MFRVTWRRLAAVSLFWVAAAVPAAAGTFILTGPRTFTRAEGAPVTEAFQVTAPATTYVLRVESDGVASALITVNGATVFDPSHFSDQPRAYERAISLRPVNRFTVEVRGKPGGVLRLWIVGTDDTPPVIRATATPPGNAAGWNTTDVTVSFACEDGISGVQTCPPPVVVSSEGAQQTITGEAIDIAGNRATASVTLNIDKTAPAVSAAITPPANADGWHGGPATVSFTCADAGSGIAVCPAPLTVGGAGANQVVTGTAVDQAGNTALATAALNIDLTAPQLTYTLSSPPNAAGWHRENVTVSFECADDLSGYSACPAPQVVSTEGADRQATASLTDRAGHTSTVTVQVSLDKTPPTIAPSLEPAPNAEGWNRTPVVVSFACADGGSGVASCTTPVTVSEHVNGRTIEGLVVDRAGNEARATASVRLDLTAPTIQATASASGVTNTDVTVTFTCSDEESGIANCPAPVTVTEEGLNQTIEGTAVDRAGNSSRATVVVSIDRTSPTISATLVPAANGAGWNNAAPVRVVFACADTGSGVKSCPDPIDISAEGANQPVTGTAVDIAGNNASVEIPVNLDLTPPAIVAEPSAGGWSRADVAVRFICSDTLSGIAFCTDTVGVQTDGTHQITGAAVDVAGNGATTSETVQVDKTPPTIEATPDRAPNAAGWYSAPVTVNFACADATSGIAECPAPLAVTADGAAQVASGTAADRAGNTASASATLNIDLTAPTIRIITSEAWSANDLLVTFECEDALSGVATCPAPRTISAEGATLVEATATDHAGHTATAQATVYVDKTPPTITGTLAPEPNAAGWHRADVTVTFACADAVSGIDQCTPPQVITSEGEGLQAQGLARDRAGNTATTTVTTRIDRTAPVLSVTGVQDGAIIRELPLAFSGSAADLLSGLQQVLCNGTVVPVSGGTFACSLALPGGASTVLVRALDVAGNERSLQFAVTYNPNRPPTASAGGPYSGETQKALIVDGTGSTDPEGKPLTFAWTFGDGATATGSRPSHAYAEPGTYNITLIVTDSEGETATAAASAVIVRANRQPTAHAGGPYQADAGVTVTFNAAQSSDPDGDTLTYAWTFGDGASGSGVNARHTYAAAGTYSATLLVDDNRGAKATATAQVTVRAPNQKPTANAGGPYEGHVGEPVSFTAAGSSDPDADALAYTWAFGDGATATGVSPSHAFASTGTFTVSLTVSDGRGGSASTSTMVTIRAANQPPNASAGGPYSARVGEPVAFTAAGSSDPDNDPLTYSWSFGDGRSRTGLSPSYAYEAPGSFTATVTVSDGRGGSATATAPVTITARTDQDNRAPEANAGGPYTGEAGIAVLLDGSASVDPDGDALTYAWSTSDGASGTGAKFSHVFAQAQAYTVTLTVTDALGLSSQATATVTVNPQQDRAPPIVSLSGPAHVLPGETATITAQVSDDSPIAAVRFEVNNADPADVPAPPYQRIVTVPAVVAPGTTIVVRGTARDAANNSSSATFTMTVVAEPDGTPPSVSLAAPASSAPGATVRLAAAAADNVGIEAVSFTVNGVVVATDAAAPYEATYLVPQDAAAGSTLQVGAAALDFAGNRATAAATIAIASDTDVIPPGVTLTAPTIASAGATVSLSAVATDANGVAALTFGAGGAVIATLTAPPYAVEYTIPPTLPEGATVSFEARAIDFAGLEAADSKQTRIVSLAEGSGAVVGEVYDASTGLPVEGATVRLRAPNTTAPIQETTTGERGNYLLTAAEGSFLVEVVREGWSRAHRLVGVAGGEAAVAIDARIMPLTGAATTITPVLGGRVANGAYELLVPGGSMPQAAPLSLSEVSPHAVEALTPLGWAPVIVVELAPRGLAFPQPVTLRAPLPPGVPAATPLVLGTWDEDAKAWRAVAHQVVDEGDSLLSAAVPATGQYAWLRPDTLPQAPPIPDDGALIAAVTSIAIPDAATAQVAPQPKFIFYEPGVYSDVRATLESASPLPSGTLLWSRATEHYEFTNGARIGLEPFVQDIPFFQTAANPARLEALYRVTPSMTFEALTLKSGVIGVEVVAPSAGTQTGLITSQGGRVQAGTGEAIDVPAGAASSVPVQIHRLTAAELGRALSAELGFVGAANVSFAGAQLAAGALLSVPRPAGLPDDSQILLVRVAEVQGRSEFVLVGLGAIDGDRVTTVLRLPRNGVPFEGIRTGGRYVLLTATVPVGFVAGTVLGSNGAPFAGARVSTSSFEVIALSRAAGAYIAAAKSGSSTLSALDLATSDAGAAPIAITAAGDEIALDLRLTAQPPRVTGVQPANGAINVPLASAVTAVFSEPIDPASVSGANAARVSFVGPEGAITGSIGLTAGNTVLTFRPSTPLEPEQSYTFTLSADIADLSGYTLGTAVTVQFTALDVTSPPAPAGKITADIPDASGHTRVRATNGTAAITDTVTVENLTTGALTPVILSPDGGFEVIVAALKTDKLQIRIVDLAGNETVLPLPRFSQTNPDGSVSASVDATGGLIVGPEEIAVDVPAGAFPDGAIVTLRSIAEAAFPLGLSAAQKQVFSYSGGLEVDFGGAEPQEYVDISIKAKPGDKASDQWIVAQSAVVNGVPTFNAVDMALLENGRITTASPPCPGVTGQGVYGIYKSNRDVGLNYGEIFHNDVNGGLRLDVVPAFVDIGGFVFPFPVVAMKQRMPVCMPVLSGNVSVSENKIDIEIKPEDLTPADRLVEIRNLAAGPQAKYRFPRNILEYAFRVSGKEDDPFDVIITKVDNSNVTLATDSFVVRTDPGGQTVTIRLNMDKLQVTPKQVSIVNKRTVPPTRTDFPQEVSSLKLAVAGAPGDTFEVFAVDADEVERPIPFTVLGAQYETGNLVARAVRGAIDPTPAQIAEYNGRPVCGPDGVPPACRFGDPIPLDRGVVAVKLGDVDSGERPTIPGEQFPCDYNACWEIPLSTIEWGAFAFPFTGDRTHGYALTVYYQDGERDFVRIPKFELRITDTQSGRVIRTVIAQSPPRGEPLNLGPITSDTTKPVLLEGPPRFDPFDPSQPLTFTFSERMDEASLRRVVIKDSAGRVLEIERVLLAGDGRSATFVTKGGLRFAETYTIDFAPAADAAGNPVLARTITLRTFEPRQICPQEAGCPTIDTGAMRASVIQGADIRSQTPGSDGTALLEPISDIAILRKRETEDAPLKTTLYLTLGGYATGFRLATFDVTNPAAPSELGRAFGGRGKRRMTLISGLKNFRVAAPNWTPGMPDNPYVFTNPPDADPCYVQDQLFTGDIAVTTSFTADSSFLTFYDVTKPFDPCVLGDKVVTASPFALSSYNRYNTIHASGFARAVAALPHQEGITVFAAVGEVGVTATDLAKNIPARYPDARLPDGLYSGDVIDLALFKDRLLVARRDGNKLEVLDPSMNPLAAVDLTMPPVSLVAAEDVQFDANEDGFISPDEVRDLVFVAGDTCSWGGNAGQSSGAGACSGSLEVIDLTSMGAPRKIGDFRLPGAVHSLDIDAPRNRILVGGSLFQQHGSGSAVYLLDISRPDQDTFLDSDADGWDDRIVWRQRYPVARPEAVRFDRERGLAYIGLSYYTQTMAERGALDIWALYDDCCDLLVDFTKVPQTEERTGSRQELLAREKAALQTGMAAALQEAAARWGAVSGLVVMEQGSGACIWRGESGDCDETYQPGVSDHDFEVFFPNLPPDAGGELPLQINCTIAQLNYTFTKPIVVNGREFSFDDVTFYPVSLTEFERGHLGVHPAKGINPELCGINEPAAGSDPGGDHGMGRQQLLLKWLLEGEYVTGVAGFSLAGPDQDQILQRLRLGYQIGPSPTGVPLVDGYEWARLMEYNLAKAKVYVRMKGASETTSAFHSLFQKQLHDAGKVGIRAAMARMTANAESNKKVVYGISRSNYNSPSGCVEPKKDVPSASWPSASCTSFEQYVASAAVRSGIFQETELQAIGRFYRVKSDKEAITSEPAADQFIGVTHAFVEHAATQTYETYRSSINTDRDVAQRTLNLATLVGIGLGPTSRDGELGEALTKAKLQLAPRIANEGFRNADNVLLAMYRGVTATGVGTQVKSVRVSLVGGESRVIKATADSGTPVSERNLNDISEVDPPDPRNKPQFLLGSNDSGNPYLNQGSDFGVPQSVVFTIDLPTKSGDPGKKMKEADRTNNYGGFTFYILDRQAPTPPGGPEPLPLPVSDPDAIEPDASCVDAPTIQVISQRITQEENQSIRVALLNTSGTVLSDVIICSDLAQTCQSVGTVGLDQLLNVDIPFQAPAQAATLGSNVTVYGKTPDGRSIKLQWSDQVLNVGSRFTINAYDNTPLNALDHPLSRWTTNRHTTGEDAALFGAVTDGTKKAVRLRIERLQPGVPARIRLLDTETKNVEQGLGALEFGGTTGSELLVTPDLSGGVELYYTPPAVFVRSGYEDKDFGRLQRGVRFSILQEGVGSSLADLELRRPPVFLVHGLFGDIHVWKDFTPLVPQVPAEYYVPRHGFDGRFDLFVAGRPHASERFAVGADQVRADIAFSLQGYLPRYAIGKVDIVGHSMGGVLSRKLTNEDPKFREAVRKLILINSPQGGSQVADKIVEARDKAPLKFEPKEIVDFISADPGSLLRNRPELKDSIKKDWCSLMLNTLGQSGLLNVHNGGVDDLQIALTNADGTPTEIGRLVNGGWNVPTHHVVDTTTQNDLGFSFEVSGMWTVLGLGCNLTPDATTIEKTKLLRIGAEALKTLIPITKAAAASRTRTLGAWKYSEAKKLLLDALEGSVKKGVEEIFGLEDPAIVFDSPNDRVVPTFSQLGNGKNLPGPLSFGHSAVSEVFGTTDHQAAKITPGISVNLCKTVDTSGMPRIDDRVVDLNGDGKPDPTCRVISLLEEDPASSKFFKTSVQQ